MQNNTRIERAGPCAHTEPIQSGVAECAVDALAGTHRAHARAASEMGHDDAAFGNLWGDLRQDGSNVFIGQAVKAVSLHAGLTNFSRQWNELGHRRLSTMETGIEAGNLRHVG